MTSRWRRRSLLRAGATVGALSLAGCSGFENPFGGGGSSGAPDSWPMFQNGPEHRGANPGASGPSNSMDAAWRTDARTLAPEYEDEMLPATVSDAVVAGGTVYVTASNLRGSVGLHLVAVDGESGTVNWRTQLVETYVSSGGNLPRPAIANGTVYVANPTAFESAPLYAVDAASGDVLWEDESDRLPRTSATIRDGQIVVGGSTAFALETDGSQAWEFDGEIQVDGETRDAQVYGYWPPTVTNDAVYVPTYERLYAIDRQGAERWSRNLRFEQELLQVYTRPKTPVAGDAIYVCSGSLEQRGDGRLLALDPSTGQTRWQFKPAYDAARREERLEEMAEEGRRLPVWSVGVYGTPALWNGTLYVHGFAMPPEGQEESIPMLYAIDAASGERQWATRLPDAFGFTPPAVAGGTVYVACGPTLVAIDAQSGDRLGSYTGEGAFDSIAVVGDKLYASDRGSLVAIGQ